MTASNETAFQLVTDAVCRYATGLDTADASLLRSAFTSNAILDLSGLSVLGLQFPPFQGRETIVDVCMKYVGEALDTSHTLSNFRVKVDGERDAKMSYLVEARHFRKGQSLSLEEKEDFCTKSVYEGAVTVEDGEWRLTTLSVRPMWCTGNVDVMKG
mgnify:CR=1 FL=1